jgi:hypothetical protein
MARSAWSRPVALGRGAHGSEGPADLLDGPLQPCHQPGIAVIPQRSTDYQAQQSQIALLGERESEWSIRQRRPTSRSPRLGKGDIAIASSTSRIPARTGAACERDTAGPCSRGLQEHAMKGTAVYYSSSPTTVVSAPAGYWSSMSADLGAVAARLSRPARGSTTGVIGHHLSRVSVGADSTPSVAGIGAP